MTDLEFTAIGWLATAFVAGIVEVASPHFGLIFVSIGAVAAAFVAFMGYGMSAQGVTFVVALLVSLVTLRKRMTGRLGGRGVPTRTAPLIGRQGIVTHDIDPIVGSGRVNVGGEDWAAKSPEAIAVGTTIRVVAADGIVLEVRRA
jgi:membrane protein implicated in regulation of membrane protease activity